MFVYFRDSGFRAEVPEECRWLYDLDYLPPGGEAGVARLGGEVELGSDVPVWVAST